MKIEFLDMYKRLGKFIKDEELDIQLSTIYTDREVRETLLDYINDLIRNVKDSIQVEKIDRLLDTFAPALIDLCQLYKYVDEMEGAVTRVPEEEQQKEFKHEDLMYDYAKWVGMLVTDPTMKGAYLDPKHYLEEFVGNVSLPAREECIRFLLEWYNIDDTEKYLDETFYWED